MFDFLKRKKMDHKTALHAALGDYTLPSFSKIDLELMRRIRQPDISSGEIAEFLELDPALSVKLLALANSAAFTPRHEVRSVTMAVSLLGLSQVESLVMSATLKKGIPAIRDAQLETGTFWRTAALRGVIARDLAKRICPAQAPECFSAGFLQDLAVPFLLNHRPDDYGPIVETWHEGESAFQEAERKQFNWDHAEVATWIAHEWDLPAGLVSAIGGHHTPDDPEYDCPIPVALVANLSDSAESLARLCARLEAYLAPEAISILVQEAQETVDDFARFLT